MSIVIKWLQDEEGIKFVNVGAEDIFSNNARIILGLIWTLILHYQVGASSDAVNATLLKAIASSPFPDWRGS